MSQNKKFSFKGKQILLLGLVALVITAGYYRWTVETEKYNSVAVTSDTLPTANTEDGGGNESTNEQTENKSLAQLKQERDSARSESIEQWKNAVSDGDASQEEKKESEKRAKLLNEYVEKEKSIETLVKAKGYSDCFAYINEGGVTVRVTGGEIDGSKIAQIKDIIVDETGVDVRDIKISAE